MTSAAILSDSAQELQLLRESAAQFAARHSGLPRLRSRRDCGVELDANVWRELAANGFLAAAIPERFGGLNLPLDCSAAIAEEFGRTLLPEPYISGAASVAAVLLKADNEKLKERLLPAIAAGELIAALAWEEHPDSIATEATATRASLTRNGVELNGCKRFVRPGAMLHGFVVSALTDGGALGLYWVPGNTPGLQIRTSRLADGGHVLDLELQSVRVAADGILSDDSAGRGALSGAIDESLVLISAELVGIAGQALTVTLDYLRERKQFGKPIGSFQALQHRAVNLYIQLQLAEVALESALSTFRTAADERTRGLAASRAKARCSDAAMAITREAIQMHGAIGFTDECAVSLYFKRALIQSAWLGNAWQHRRRYARLAMVGGRGNA